MIDCKGLRERKCLKKYMYTKSLPVPELLFMEFSRKLEFIFYTHGDNLPKYETGHFIFYICYELLLHNRDNKLKF